VQDAEEHVAFREDQIGRHRHGESRTADPREPRQGSPAPDSGPVGEHQPDADEDEKAPGDQMGRTPADRRQRVVLGRQAKKAEIPGCMIKRHRREGHAACDVEGIDPAVLACRDRGGCCEIGGGERHAPA
jgi:hypothetical protein